MKVKYKKAGRDVQAMPNKIRTGMAVKQVNDIQEGISKKPFSNKKGKMTLF